MVGTLRLGFTQTTGGQHLHRLVERFEQSHPSVRLNVQEVPVDAPYAPLRAGELDVVINWQAGDIPDLTYGPVLLLAPRAVMVGNSHPLAGREVVSTEDLADYQTPNFQPTDMIDSPRLEAIIPRATNSGRPIRTHPAPVRSVSEAAMLVARGQAVWPTVAPIGRYGRPDGISFVPVTDLPPLPGGVIWRTGRSSARIQALCRITVEVAAS